MAIIQGNAKQGSTRGFYPKVINGSLRYNSGDTSYLFWKPTSASNRKTWTWSGWLKGDLYKAGIFAAGNDITVNNNYMSIVVESDYTLRLVAYTTNAFNCKTNAVLRDPSAWYHVVVAFDTTQATAANRVKIYINGVLQSLNSPTYPNQNVDHFINNNIDHSLGRMFESDYYMNGYMANVHFIDGQALTPSDFGETKNGVWVAKDYAGSFGTNGFYLTFEDDTQVEAFNTVLYRGDGSSTGQSITGVGFQPDLIWIKKRSGANSHNLIDSVRGADKRLYSDLTNAEASNTGFTIDSDGFTTTSAGSQNEAGFTFVGWCWKAGDSNVSNTDGTITSTVRANQTYGFSIVKYTGDGTGGSTVGHGLSSAPEMVIVKVNETGYDWPVYHVGVGADKVVTLNLTTEAQQQTNKFNDTAPSNTVVTLGANHGTNRNGQSHIMYCFHSVTGYSKFGSYAGDSTTDGSNAINVGFKPALVMIKHYEDTAGTYNGDWFIYDNTRDVVDGDGYLRANLANGETANGGMLKLTANGFALYTNSGSHNETNNNYIYAAFADTREAAFWLDQSGNDNDWQPVNLDHNDTVADSPTNNFATLNPLAPYSAGTYSEGNLKVTTGSSQYGPVLSTIAVSSGKYYCEMTERTTGSIYTAFGGYSTSKAISTTTGVDSAGVGSFCMKANTGNFVVDGSETSYGSSWTTGDVIGMALNLDDNEVTFYKNGVSQGTRSITAGEYYIAASDNWGAGTSTFELNFGQQPFKYDPPA